MATTAPNHLTYLLSQYISETATPAEMDELTILLQEKENTDAIRTILQDLKKDTYRTITTEKSEVDSLINRIIEVYPAEARVVKTNKQWLRYAAAALFIIAVGASFWMFRKPSPEAMVNNKIKTEDIAPGGDRALLTLADGRTIVLDSVANGNLAQQGAIKIIKLENGQLAYHVNAKPEQTHGVLYNTITTPRGGQYQVVLSDGSKVWLNAASSLRFPIAFTGNERHVEVTGEAYFEITEDKSKPFRVSSEKINIQVLGTSFNINAYYDEPVIKTTLLEGSIKLINGSSEKRIQPGQQARIKKDQDEIKVLSNANIEEVMAWKNGYFQMAGADVPSIMRQVCRWYDVEIQYKGGVVPQKLLGGRLSRNGNLSEMLKIFEVYDIRSERKGKTIIINP